MLHPTLYWIEGASPWRLAIMSRPRGNEDLADELSTLARLGVGAVVSLLEPAESRELGLRNEQALCEENRLTFTSLPIPDRGVPKEASAFVASVKSLQRQLHAGTAMAAHCRAGIGRSGLLVASLLVASGHSPSEAFAITSKARGVGVPDTRAQEVWLQTHARRLQSAA